MMARKPAPVPRPSMPLTPATAISESGLLGAYFKGSSWDLWRAVLKAAWGEALTEPELELFRSVAERDPPTRQVNELWAIAGRRAGKDSVASGIAVVCALADYSESLRPGERAQIMCIASTKDQAGIIFRYILGYFQKLPELAGLIVRETDDTIELANGSEIVVATNSYRNVRGWSVVVAIFDEVAFYRSDESSNPDTELYEAVSAAMGTFHEKRLLIGISSPYRKQGLLFDRWRACYGKNDPETLVVRGASRVFNKTLPQKIIDAAMARDIEKASSEYLAEWRDDLSDFLDRDLVQSAVDDGVVVRPPRRDVDYRMFVDPSGGRGDSFTACIAHVEVGSGQRVAGILGRAWGALTGGAPASDGDLIVIDALFEKRGNHNPIEVTRDIASLARSYNVSRAVGDHFAANWVVQAFADVGIHYEHSKMNRSGLYLEVLPLFTSGRLRILDNPRLVHQFVSLERRTGRSGKDTIQHPDGSYDDLANAAAGAAVMLASDARIALIRPGDLLTSDQQAVEPHKLPEGFTATLWLDRQGGCGWTIWSYRNVDGIEPVPLVLIDFDKEPFTMLVIDGIVDRLDALHRAKIGAEPQLQHRIAVVLSVPVQLVPAAQGAMNRRFSARRAAMENFNSMRQWSPRMAADAVGAAFVEQAEQVLFDAHAFVSEGRVKMSPGALERSKGRPLAGILSVLSGERVDADPLRMAALIEIRGLGMELKRLDGHGAPMRW